MHQGFRLLSLHVDFKQNLSLALTQTGKKGLYSAKHPLNVKRQIKAVKMKEQSEDEDSQGAAEGFSLEFFL